MTAELFPNTPLVAPREKLPTAEISSGRMHRILHSIGDRATQAFLHPIETIELSGQVIFFSKQEKEFMNTNYPWVSRLKSKQ